ncbi:MAG TPA: sulfotransferase [Mycobacteriales bacterium]|nr:sulfotransferase [Mycobacteriales bacterium]
MALPDFLVIGAPKAGTTALHVALAAHPQLCLSANKEPKHFLVDGPPPTRGGPGDARTYAEYVWRRADYEALWDHAEPGQLRGESTTLYLRDPAAHERIRAAVPGVKLVAVLRDPVDRAHSNWSHLRSAGLEPEADFLRACALEHRRVEDGWGPFWRYLGLGMYGAQLQHLYSLFPREQVLVLLYRELREQPLETLDRICAFLGVDTGLLRQLPAENVTAHVSDTAVNRLLHGALRQAGALGALAPEPVRRLASATAVRLLQREQRTRPALSPDERGLLVPHFLSDIALLEEITDRSLQHWRDPRNTLSRRALDVDRRFGTAFSSIDSPLQRRRSPA